MSTSARAKKLVEALLSARPLNEEGPGAEKLSAEEIKRMKAEYQEAYREAGREERYNPTKSRRAHELARSLSQRLRAAGIDPLSEALQLNEEDIEKLKLAYKEAVTKGNAERAERFRRELIALGITPEEKYSASEIARMKQGYLDDWREAKSGGRDSNWAAERARLALQHLKDAGVDVSDLERSERGYGGAPGPRR